jgi:hypothetical protein
LMSTFTQTCGAMNRGALSDPSFIHSFIKKTFDEKEATQKNTKGIIKKISDEKDAIPKNAKGLIKKTSDEKRGNPPKKKRGA